MSFQDTRSLLDFLLAQVAAESFLDDFATISESDLRKRLELGPTHYNYDELVKSQDKESSTRSTELMKDEFQSTWDILHQLPNTESGLSVTILKHKESGELTFSFRSTESNTRDIGGDMERDGPDAADGEIMNVGFAIGQILKYKSLRPFYSLMDTPDVKSLDGIPMDELKAIRDANGGSLDKVFEHVRNHSLLQVVLSGLKDGNYQDYLRITPDDYGSELAKGHKLQSVVETLKALVENSSERYTEFKQWAYAATDMGEAMFENSAKVGNKHGPVGVVVIVIRHHGLSQKLAGGNGAQSGIPKPFLKKNDFAMFEWK